jgi:hypothetical protein
MSTAYHPQTESQTEHINQVLEGYLRIFTSQQQDDWDDFLPLGKFSHNDSVHLLTQQTPFMVDTGRHPRMVKVMSPFFQSSDDGEHLSAMNIIILLNRVQHF